MRYIRWGKGRSDLRGPPCASSAVVRRAECALRPSAWVASCGRGAPPAVGMGSPLRRQEGSTKSNSHWTFNFGLLSAMHTASATASRFLSGSR